MKKALFIGGPGNISTSTVKELLEQNWEVGVFTLPESPDKGLEGKVRFFRGNRNKPEELDAAITQFNPEVVLDFVCFTPKQATQIVDLTYGRIKQFIFVSTCDVYGYPLSRLPMEEDDPWNLPNCKYASDKRGCEDIFWKKFKEDKKKFPLTVARPSYSMGETFVITAFSRGGGKYLIPRLRAGMPILVPGDGTTLIHPSVAYNTGRMIAQFTGVKECIGKSYTCGQDTFMTHDDYIKLFAKVLGVEPNIVHIPTDLLYSLDSDEVKDSILNDLTRHNVAFSMANFKKDFPNFKWNMPLEEIAKQYIQWNDENGTFADIGEEIYEDKVIKNWGKMLHNFKVE